jgi:hypothetical protein
MLLMAVCFSFEISIFFSLELLYYIMTVLCIAIKAKGVVVTKQRDWFISLVYKEGYCEK